MKYKNNKKFYSAPMLTLMGMGLLSTLSLQAEPFPWWYSKLLSWHIPLWAIQMLEQPWIVASIAIGFFIFKALLVGYITSKLIKTKRSLKQLREEHTKLINAHEHLKTAHLHHQTMIAHLTTLVAHQATVKQSSSPQLILPPPPSVECDQKS